MRPDSALPIASLLVRTRGHSFLWPYLPFLALAKRLAGPLMASATLPCLGELQAPAVIRHLPRCRLFPLIAQAA